MKNLKIYLVSLVLIIATLALGCDTTNKSILINQSNAAVETAVSDNSNENKNKVNTGLTHNHINDFLLDTVPEYSDKPYIEINENVPFFTDEEDTTTSFEFYSDKDALNRCRQAYANIGKELMPTEKRGKIGQIKPSGWQLVKYDIVDGKYLYNRCHLIGYQLTAENANEKNLITGTRYLNVQGMLPFENMVADYIKETNNHVLYRVTPIFDGDNLVASGVLMEAESVEDGGTGISYNVFVYNIQPGVKIDYLTGESWLLGLEQTEKKEQLEILLNYVINTNSMKFHISECDSVKKISPSNKELFFGSRESLLKEEYSPCGVCKP